MIFSGIGKEAAKDLAGRGARVILACRNLRKANDAVQEIREIFPEAQLVVKHVDMCSLTSVKTFATDILKEEPRVDVLINNAGWRLQTIRLDSFQLG